MIFVYLCLHNFIFQFLFFKDLSSLTTIQNNIFDYPLKIFFFNFQLIYLISNLAFIIQLQLVFEIKKKF